MFTIDTAIEIAAPPARIRDAITTQAGFRAWFAQAARRMASITRRRAATCSQAPGQLGAPALQRRDERLLHRRFDQIQPPRPERPLQRRRDGGRVLSIERVEVGHARQFRSPRRAFAHAV